MVSTFFIILGSGIGLYVIFILVKPASDADLFFELHKKTSEADILHRIEILERRHHANYTPEKEKIRRYFADGKLTDKEVEFLEDKMTMAFFNGFKKKWAVFREADVFSRLIFSGLILASFFSVALTYAYGTHKYPDFDHVLRGLVVAILGCPVTYAAALIITGTFSLLMTVLRFIFPSKGSLARATVLSEEFVKALKPGGRSTHVVLPKFREGFGNFWP